MQVTIPRSLARAVIVTAAIGVVSTALADAAIPVRFRGDWQGSLNIAGVPDKPESWEWSNPLDVRIVISKKGAKVYIRVDGKWDQVHPGTFGMSVFESNAVITSISTGGSWVETWSFAVSLRDPKHLQTSFQRQVNNTHMGRDDSNSVWGAYAFGVLVRTPDDV